MSSTGCCGGTRTYTPMERPLTSEERIQNPLPVVSTFICGRCGDVRPGKLPGYSHACQGIRPVSWRDKRRAICDQCPSVMSEWDDEAAGFICLAEQEAHPERVNLIANGVMIPTHRCRRGHWPRVAMRCPHCDSITYHGEWEPIVCDYCGKSRFEPSPGTVGFIGPAYMRIGGTETFHRILSNRLADVAGVVALNPPMAQGDPGQLGCPFGIGLDDARKLAEACETLVVWGLGQELSAVLEGLPRKRVISVAHCDNRSAWTVQMMKGQAEHTERFVYLEPNGLKAIPSKRRHDSQMIRNGIPKSRIRTKLSRSEARARLGIPHSTKLMVALCRMSPEKAIHQMVDAVNSMDDRFRLIIAGSPYHNDENYAAATKWSERASSIGPIDRPGDLLAAADAYLSLSTIEGAGLSMIEAALAGVPLISTPVGIVQTFPSIAHIIPHDTPPAEVGRSITEFFESGVAPHIAESAGRVMRERYSENRFVGEWAHLLGVAEKPA